MAQTKGIKKMSEETKEIDFGDVELQLEKPELNEDKTLTIRGNFQDAGAKIKAVVDRYKNVQLTEDNVDYVKTLKKQFVSLRRGVELKKDDYMKVYINPAKDLVNAMCKELLAIIDEGESALGKQLDEYDQRRKDEITTVLNEHIDFTAEKLGLREEYKAQIQLKKEYYNKTQNEADSMTDIEMQANELLKKQKEYDTSVELIKAECEDADFIPDAYIRELQYKSSAEVLLEIKHDKKVRDESKAKAETEGKLVVGATPDSEIAQQIKKAETMNSKEAETRTRVLRVTYKAQNAKAIAKALTELCTSFEFVKTDF